MPGKQNTKPMKATVMAGFTLIELMIVLVILSILLFVAVPNYDSVINDSKLDKARHNVASGLALARVEAVQRGQDVSFCRGSSGACGAGTGLTNWSGNGWKVRDAAEIIRIDDADNTGVTVTYECGDTLTYNSLGALTSSLTGTECQFVFVDPQGVAAASYLCIAATGRVRMSENACE